MKHSSGKSDVRVIPLGFACFLPLSNQPLGEDSKEWAAGQINGYSGLDLASKQQLGRSGLDQKKKELK